MKKLIRNHPLAMFFVSVAVSVMLALIAFYATPNKPAPQEERVVQQEETLTADELEAKIHFTCTYCHAFPSPETFTKDKWHFELLQAYAFTQESNIDRERIPPFQQTLDYFQLRAPESFALPLTLEQAEQESQSLFRQHGYPFANGPDYPGASHVKWVHLRSDDDGRPDCLMCDMLNNTVLLWQSDQPDQGVRILAHVLHPGHAEVIDLDQDGHRDILVAGLGSVEPTNANVGQVIWLRYLPRQDRYERFILLEGIGRVADVRATDFDGDGDVDLVVAAFGWLEIGELLYLENRTTDYNHPDFRPTTIDDRTGTIHVPIVDLNNDGRPDFVALFSQEHEAVVAFINEGPARFRKELIYAEANPGYGSSGIQLTDIDGDGDIDVLFTNGDTLDLKTFKPFHSVQWLENQGNFPFRHHHLIDLPGAFSAVASDLDLDGDQDIVAVSWIPDVIDGIPDGPRRKLMSILWLEQQKPLRFVLRVLETGHYYHTSVDVADFDSDGDADLLIGNCIFPQSELARQVAPHGDWFTIWENRAANTK